MLSLNLQELRDQESEIKAELQHARNMRNLEAVRLWTKDLVEYQTLIRNHN